jgi:hypothetical protein
MVISLWQGDTCTGTFRLPAHEAARLISALAYGMTEAISGQGPPSDAEPPRFRQIWTRVQRRLVTRLQRGTGSHLRLLE